MVISTKRLKFSGLRMSILWRNPLGTKIGLHAAQIEITELNIEGYSLIKKGEVQCCLMPFFSPQKFQNVHLTSGITDRRVIIVLVNSSSGGSRKWINPFLLATLLLVTRSGTSSCIRK